MHALLAQQPACPVWEKRRHLRAAFDLARLEQLLGEEPGTRADTARSLRLRYYLVHAPVRTLAEFAELLNHWSMWE